MKPKKKSAARAASASSVTEPTQEEISICAYLIWEQEGRPQGRDIEHWYQAETQLRQARTGYNPLAGESW